MDEIGPACFRARRASLAGGAGGRQGDRPSVAWSEIGPPAAGACDGREDPAELVADQGYQSRTTPKRDGFLRWHGDDAARSTQVRRRRWPASNRKPGRQRLGIHTWPAEAGVPCGSLASLIGRSRRRQGKAALRARLFQRTERDADIVRPDMASVVSKAR